MTSQISAANREPAGQISRPRPILLQKLNGSRQIDPDQTRKIQIQVKKRTGELGKEQERLRGEAEELSRQIEERLSQLKLVTLPEVRRNLENDIARLQSEHQLLLLAQNQNRDQVEGLLASSKANPASLLKIFAKEAAQELKENEMTRQKIKTIVSSIVLKDTELIIRLPLLVSGTNRHGDNGSSAPVIEEKVPLPGIFLLRSRALLEQLLQGGLSRNEIARRLNVSPAAVGTAIYRLGLLGPEGTSGHTGRIPFGYEMRDGKLSKNQGEQKAILLIRQMKKNGESLRKIADELNRRRIQTKQGGVWQAGTVKKILVRLNLGHD